MQNISCKLNILSKILDELVEKLSLSPFPLNFVSRFRHKSGLRSTCKHFQVILLTFKNFPLRGQQQGYCSKQAIDNFIHVDTAVVALTPSRGVNWQLFCLLT